VDRVATARRRPGRVGLTRMGVAVLLVLPLLASCGLAKGGQARGGDGGGGSAPKQVTVWHEFTAGSEAIGIKAINKGFTDQGKYTVKQRPIANEQLFTVERTGLAGSLPPDVVQYEGYQQTRDFAKAGQLTDLTDLWNANSDKFLLKESAKASCSYEGKIYCIPYTFATGTQIYYNADLLKKQGIAPPQTYEQFLAAAKKLKDAGITPIAIGAKDGWPAEHWWMLFLVQRCGVATVEKAEAKNGAKFTDACFVQAAQDLASLASNGYFSKGAASDDYGTATSVYRAGKAAFFQTGSWLASGLESEPTTFTTAILPFPRMKDDQHPGDIVGAVTHVFGIPTKAKNPEGAKAYLEYLMSDPATTVWAKSGNLSLRSGAVEKNTGKELQPLWKSVLSADASLPWLENELPPGVGEDKIYNGTAAIVAGRMQPKEFVQSVQTALDAAK
jgi:raffinose/stachyose/melibiose transport system substrate-binding protein